MADLFGRRRVLLVGALFCGLGHSLLLIAEGFWTLALYELLLGISFSLTSGSDLALLYDSELALGASAERQRRVVGKIYSLGTLSGALSGAVCFDIAWWLFCRSHLGSGHCGLDTFRGRVGAG